MLKTFWPARPEKVSSGAARRLICISGFNVSWRKSARRSRSLALKVDKAGQLIVMTPLRTPEQDVRQFVEAKRAWIGQQLTQYEALSAQKERARGASFHFLGASLDIKAAIGSHNACEQRDNTLYVVSRLSEPDKDYLEIRASHWLREQAEERLPQRLQLLSSQTGLTGQGVQIKSYRARWGSCRHDRVIQLNWKLIMAPPAVIDYVLIHELSHLKHFNHSAVFWELVSRHCPDYKEHRLWLKQHGRLLISRI